jgi:hypothetical protein
MGLISLKKHSLTRIQFKQLADVPSLPGARTWKDADWRPASEVSAEFRATRLDRPAKLASDRERRRFANTPPRPLLSILAAVLFLAALAIVPWIWGKNAFEVWMLFIAPLLAGGPGAAIRPNGGSPTWHTRGGTIDASDACPGARFRRHRWCFICTGEGTSLSAGRRNSAGVRHVYLDPTPFVIPRTCAFISYFGGIITRR